MSRWRSALIPAALALMLAGAWAASRPDVDLDTPVVRSALDSIEPAPLGAHVRFLADDLLEGRGTGSRGYDLSARYVAAQLEARGVEPAGPGGSWFQPVPMRKVDLVPGSAVVSLQSGGRVVTLEHERDFVMGGDPLRLESEVEAPVVFVGFGVTAPELGHDDFAGVDARGKIVAVISGAPSRFPAAVRAHYSNGRVRDANFAAHGAVGALTLRRPSDETRSPWPRTVRQSRFASIRWLDARGRPDGVQPTLRGSATLSRSGAEALFQGAPRTLDAVFDAAEEGKPQGFALPVRARIGRRSRHESLASSNVAGRLEGSDPKLRGESVVFTAHLDHLGIGTPVEGDSIYNGAFDNATGIAALIELAGAFARMSPRPRRSMLFVALTGEEKGLQGSGYMAEHPLPGSGRLVANLNLDMYVMVGPLRRMVAHGGDHSTLGEVARRAAARIGLEVMPDPMPEEVIFVRSDQYSFVRRGIPSLFLVGHPAAAQDRRVTEWLRTRYHSPQDDLTQALDLESLARFAHVHWLAGYEVAQRDARPAWKPGDFFGRIYGRGRSEPAPRP